MAGQIAERRPTKPAPPVLKVRIEFALSATIFPALVQVAAWFFRRH